MQAFVAFQKRNVPCRVTLTHPHIVSSLCEALGLGITIYCNSAFIAVCLEVDVEVSGVEVHLVTCSVLCILIMSSAKCTKSSKQSATSF